MKTRRMYKAERLSLDRISTLPEPILETILCLLPTIEAARTSVLSRDWRYKWTKIPKLDLDHSMDCASVSKHSSSKASTRRNKNMYMRCKECYNIYQILLMRQGPVHDLTLEMPDGDFLGLDRIILHLARNHPVKKLALSGWDSDSYWCELPMSVFSLRHLTDLTIRYSDLNRPPIFNGFGSLRSLYLSYVRISTKTLLHLLSNCPLLKRLSLLSSVSGDKCTINELIECLPLIEYLTTCPDVPQLFVVDSVSQELSTSLIHLKYLNFKKNNLMDGLNFLLVLIKSSPNLEKIRLKSNDDVYYDWQESVHSVVWEKYSDIWLEHLNELEFQCFENLKYEMEFVKFILARSPKLKKMIIHSVVDEKQESKMLKTLLQAPRVSSVVITVE